MPIVVQEIAVGGLLSTRSRIHRGGVGAVADVPSGAIPSYQARLDRADEHFNTLSIEINRWLNLLHAFPVTEVDAETGIAVVSVEIREQVPDSWGPILGDVLHNFRSSLDHLAYALTVASVGSPLAPELERQTEFPIFSTESGFEQSGRLAIRGMSAEAQAVIEELQPYRRGDDWALDPLWLLRQLSNIDKHRRATLTSLHLEPMMEVRSGSFVDVQVGESGPSDADDSPYMIGTYRRHQDDPDAQISPGYAYYVAFREDIAAKQFKVELILWTIGAHIRESIFGRLVPLL